MSQEHKGNRIEINMVSESPESLSPRHRKKGYWHRIVRWYIRYERPISSVSLIGGFIFTAFTLTRVDLFIENFWVVIHLLVVAGGIIALNYVENKTRRGEKIQFSKIFQIRRNRHYQEDEGVRDPIILKGSFHAQTESYREEVKELDEQAEEAHELSAGFATPIHFWIIFVIQFAFGGLLSTFLVFYFRSTTFDATWPFLALLGGTFIANESFKKHYSRLTFQISVLYISIYSFAIFSVPVLLHRIGADVFLISGGVSLILLGLFLVLLRYITREHFLKSRIPLYCSIIGLTALINILYFTNLIPPIPLSLKDAGVYHNIKKGSDGNYTAKEEPKSWTSFFVAYDPYHYVQGEPVYVYSAVFSPTDFSTNIVHQWQWYDDVKKAWTVESIVPLTTNGGREGGFRTYSMKTNLIPGKWRVDVETTAGQVIGRIKFEVIAAMSDPNLNTITK